MDYLEKYITLKYFNMLVPEYRQELAGKNKTTVGGLMDKLVYEVFCLKKLTPHQKEMLRSLIPDMDCDEIDMLEKVNRLPMRCVYESLGMKGETT